MTQPAVACRRGRTEQRQNTRDRLLDAATRLFLGLGYANTSIDRIAKEAGFTRGAVQRQFGSKPDLANAVLDRFYGQIIYQASAQMADLPTPGQSTDFEAFVQLVIGWVEAAVRNSRWVRLELELAVERRHNHDGPADGLAAEPERLGCLKALSVHILETTASTLRTELVVEPETIVTGLVAVVVGMTLQNEEPTVVSELVGPLVRHLLRGAGSVASMDEPT
ncbi:TetR/AcrR family transcriptional regulator [Nocardia brasiliensis]